MVASKYLKEKETKVKKPPRNDRALFSNCTACQGLLKDGALYVEDNTDLFVLSQQIKTCLPRSAATGEAYTDKDMRKEALREYQVLCIYAFYPEYGEFIDFGELGEFEGKKKYWSRRYEEFAKDGQDIILIANIAKTLFNKSEISPEIEDIGFIDPESSALKKLKKMMSNLLASQSEIEISEEFRAKDKLEKAVIRNDFVKERNKLVQNQQEHTQLQLVKCWGILNLQFTDVTSKTMAAFRKASQKQLTETDLEWRDRVKRDREATLYTFKTEQVKLFYKNKGDYRIPKGRINQLGV